MSKHPRSIATEKFHLARGLNQWPQGYLFDLLPTEQSGRTHYVKTPKYMRQWFVTKHFFIKQFTYKFLWRTLYKNTFSFLDKQYDLYLDTCKQNVIFKAESYQGFHNGKIQIEYVLLKEYELLKLFRIITIATDFAHLLTFNPCLRVFVVSFLRVASENEKDKTAFVVFCVGFFVSLMSDGIQARH
jgi:hypothetical protein